MRLCVTDITSAPRIPTSKRSKSVRRFQLLEAIAPFTRCLNCNSPLAHVTKNEIEPLLEPLTKIYYDDSPPMFGLRKNLLGRLTFSQTPGTHCRRRTEATHSRPAKPAQKEFSDEWYSRGHMLFKVLANRER